MATGEVVPSSTKKKTAVAKREKRPDIKALGIEQGTDTLLPFSTPFRGAFLGTKKNENEELQEYLRDESEEMGPTVRQLTTMRRMDGQARALYRLMTLPIRSALTTASFIPADDGEEEAEFIDAVFNTPPASGGMTTTMHRFMGQLTQGLFDGFSAFEKVFWTPETGPLKGKITLKKLAHRPSETITFVVDKEGGFAGLRQKAQMGGKSLDVYIPREQAFYYAAQEEERKFYGVSFFQSAFYHYDKKVKMYYIAHVAAQRAAVGTRVGTVPANATNAAKTEFAQGLSNLALAQFMMVPEGFEVEILKDGGTFAFLEYINHHNSQMSKSVLAGFFDKEQGKGETDNSLINFAQPGDDMFILMLRAVMDDIANQINHYIIPQLIDYNFSGGKYPKFTWGKLTDEQKSAIASTFDKLLSSPGNVTPEFIRALEEHQAEEFGLEIDYDEVDAREEEESAAMSGIDPTTQLPFPVDPETGEAMTPEVPGAEGELPAGGAPTPSATPAGSAPSAVAAPAQTQASTGSAAPTESTTPEDPANDPANAEWGLTGDWGFEDMEMFLESAELDPEAEEEDEADEFDRKLSLAAQDGADLIRLTSELLELVGDDNYGS